MVTLDLERVGLEDIGLAAAAHRRIVGLHEDWNHWRMAAGEPTHCPLSLATAGNSMASAHRAEKDNFIGDLLWARRLLSRSAKGALKLHKIEFLDWLASPEGPQPSRSLKAIETSARTWVLIWARRALLGSFRSRYRVAVFMFQPVKM